MNVFIVSMTTGRSTDTDEFIAMEIVGGHVRFSFALGDGSITRVTVSKGVSDGRWHHVFADRNGKVCAVIFLTFPPILHVLDCFQNMDVLI